MVDVAAPRNKWVGRVIKGRWHIDTRLARGGVGTVFAATHKNNGNRVALKILHPEFSRDEDTKSRFLQEGYAANQVNHPGVVRILDDDTTEEGFAYLVMELLEGELLERRRQRLGGRLPIVEVYEIADQLLDVLAAAHEKGIVHRDIKPDNLFLTTEGRLKVLDFGFAQMKGGVRREQTATGFLLGTPGFMSPEQALGARGQVDAKTDIWAVGATLFTLLSGQPVHDGESAAEMLVAAANYEARSLATVTAGLPTKLVQIVDRALAFDKRARWPSAPAMKNALLDVPGRMGDAPPPSSENPTEAIPNSEGNTLFFAPIVVEELPEDDLEDASPSWPDQRTVAGAVSLDPAMLADVPSPISDPRIPSVRPAAGRRPSFVAEEEIVTRARPTPREAMNPVPGSYPAPPPRPSYHPTDEHGGTLVMTTPLQQPTGTGAYRAMSVPPVAPSSGPGRGPMPSLPPRPSYASNPSYDAVPPTASGPMLYTPPTQARSVRPAAPSGGGRALLLVGVVVVTMIVVVVTGLLVLAASD